MLLLQNLFNKYRVLFKRDQYDAGLKEMFKKRKMKLLENISCFEKVQFFKQAIKRIFFIKTRYLLYFEKRIVPFKSSGVIILDVQLP